MPEQFAFHKGSHHGGAIDRDERAVGTYIMDRSRHDFLAGSRLAQQQRRPAALTQFLDQTENLPGSGRLADKDVTSFFEVG